MDTTVVQRWREHRSSYRPAGETIDTSRYEIAACPASEARTFVETHHYSGTWPAARRCFGLYRGGAGLAGGGTLVGVAAYSHPMADAVLTRCFGGAARESLELGRFVLLDDVPANGETWFLARTFTALRREDFRGVVAYSDPLARTTADGRMVFRGHLGTIYRAHNAVYTGRGEGRTLRLLPDGTVMSQRALSKIRGHERGWEYAVRMLQQHGAGPMAGDAGEWLKTWLPRITRPLRHPGCLRYAWPLRKSVRVLLPRLPYERVVP